MSEIEALRQLSRLYRLTSRLYRLSSVYVRERHLDCVEATVEAEDKWVQHVHDVGHATLFPLCPNSWYVGANVQGKPRVFTPYIGGVAVYRQTCDEVAANDYEGFALSRAAQHIPRAKPATAAWG